MIEIDLPEGWVAEKFRGGPSQEYNPSKQPIARFERKNLYLWVTIERRDPHNGRHRDYVHYVVSIGLNADSIKDLEKEDGDYPRAIREGTERSQESMKKAFEQAVDAGRHFTHMFEEKYTESDDVLYSYEYAVEQIEDQHNLKM
jgi:hypothetical protein